MAFTSVEIIALVMIVLATIKMIVLLVKPKAWMNFAKQIYSKPNVAKAIGFVLAAIVLYYLIDAGITIVQILAVSVFVALLMMIGLASEASLIIKKLDALIKKGNLWKDYWFYSLVWIALLAWGVMELIA